MTRNAPYKFSARLLSPLLAVLDTRDHLPLRCPVARELVSDHDAWRPALPLEKFAEQTLRRPLVAPALDQHVKHHSGLIYGTPEPVLRPSDLDCDLVEVPFVSDTGQSSSDPVGELWPNLSAHCRTVSWLTTMPRAASISSTMRKLSGKRKYTQTAWLMTSAGKRNPA